MNIDEEIQKETDLIKQLESNYPARDDEAIRTRGYDGNMLMHETLIRDAYWRRRNLRDKKENA